MSLFLCVVSKNQVEYFLLFFIFQIQIHKIKCRTTNCVGEIALLVSITFLLKFEVTFVSDKSLILGGGGV